ncbi:hypothetical protein AB6A40_010012 [Gnathostoma spinigerum]|uniref:G-protein coupled receptors family 1 profile domain-containing protein n=1 Tax=Gnathostoma spinigerum TaxID=75299 RepID=A0ABD6ETL9_9BILA
MRNVSLEIIRFARMPIATFAVLNNLTVLIIILNSSGLKKNKSNLLIVQLAVGDLFTGIGFVIRAAADEVQLATRTMTFDRERCLRFASPTILGVHFSQITMFIIAIERLICIKCPITFRILSNWYSPTYLFIFSSIYAVISTSAMFLTFPGNDTVEICSGSASWARSYNFYYVISNTFISILICGKLIHHSESVCS